MMSFLATEKPLRTKASFIDLPRSTTNSSIASVFRRVKSSQQLRDRRSSSSESSYFSASQELPSSPSFSSVCSEAPEKLLRVVQELVETEVSYHKDMQLAEEFCHENPYFRQICGHLRCISEFEHEWVRLLQAAQESPDPGTAVGSLFIEKSGHLDKVYCEYCKRHEDAVSKLMQAQTIRQDIDEFVKSANQRILERTTCWDLPSLLIKPVQRILKYPLLLQEMISLTSPSHSSYSLLVMAAECVQRIANHINEMKRRKDLVQDLIAGASSNGSKTKHSASSSSVGHVSTSRRSKLHFIFLHMSTQHSIYSSKKRNSKSKKRLSKCSTYSSELQVLEHRFEQQQLVAHALVQDLLAWVDEMKKHCQQLHAFAAALENVYGTWGTVHAFSQTPFDIWVEEAVDHQIQHFINVRIPQYLDIFNGPSQLMAKRTNNKKMLQREAYEAINAQLQDELPRFLELAAQYFDILLHDLARIQADVYRSLRHAFSDLVNENGSKDILEEYHARMQTVHECTASIATLQKKEERQQQQQQQQRHRESDSFSLTGSSRSSLLLTWEEMLTMAGRSSEDAKRLSMISTATSSSISRQVEHSNSSTEDLDPSGGLLFGETKPAFSSIAIQDYKSNVPERLQLRQGDIVQILMPTDPESSNSEEDWWYGRLESGGPYGWIPARCCRYYQKA